MRSDDGCPIEAVKASQAGGDRMFMGRELLSGHTSGARAYERD